MSRLYEMVVTIKGCDKARLPAIGAACCNMWEFDAGDFSDTSAMFESPELPEDQRGLYVVASADGYLCGGESELEFADELVKAIWAANHGFCFVELKSIYLEDRPYESFTYDRDAFEEMVGCAD